MSSGKFDAVSGCKQFNVKEMAAESMAVPAAYASPSCPAR
jgi:hypothetical protein